MAAFAVREDEALRVGPALGEVELDELAGDRREQLRLAAALRLCSRDLLAGDSAVHAQALTWSAAVVEHVGPDERVRLAGAEAFVGEDADERRVLRVELPAYRLDRLRRARVDRRGTCMRDAADADDGVPREPSPLDSAVEDALQHSERSVDRRSAGAVGTEARAVGVDRLPGDLAQALAAEVGDDPLVEQRGVGGERVRAQVDGGIGIPPLDEELLERGVGADHLGGELSELPRAADRGVEELCVAPAIEVRLRFVLPRPLSYQRTTYTVRPSLRLRRSMLMAL